MHLAKHAYLTYEFLKKSTCESWKMNSVSQHPTLEYVWIYGSRNSTSTSTLKLNLPMSLRTRFVNINWYFNCASFFLPWNRNWFFTFGLFFSTYGEILVQQEMGATSKYNAINFFFLSSSIASAVILLYLLWNTILYEKNARRWVG